MRESGKIVLGILLLASTGCALDRMAADAMVPVLTRTKDSFNRKTVARYGREAAPGGGFLVLVQ